MKMALGLGQALGTNLDCVQGMEQIRRMRGGSQPHMMRCADKRSKDLYFIVKFKNNPQSRRVLVNDLFCSTLARKVALPVPRVALVDVIEDMVRYTPALQVEFPYSRIPCDPGLQFGSAYVGNPRYGIVFDALFDQDYRKISNVRHFIGMLAFDVWTCNTDGRQAVYIRTDDEEDLQEDGPGSAERPMLKKEGFEAFMIDQGFCFNGEDWSFPNPAGGINSMIYFRPSVYDKITDIDSFEPWLSNIQKVSAESMHSLAADLPNEWFVEGERDLFDQVVAGLDGRRRQLADMLLLLIKRKRDSFKNWKPKMSTFIPARARGGNPNGAPVASL